MTINDKTRNEKLQYNINREAAKILVLSSGKTHKYEYLTGEEILPSDQSRITNKTIEYQRRIQFPSLNTFKLILNN